MTHAQHIMLIYISTRQATSEVNKGREKLPELWFTFAKSDYGPVVFPIFFVEPTVVVSSFEILEFK